MKFALSIRLADENPELQRAIEVVDQLLSQVENGANFRPTQIARSKRIDENQVVSVFDLFAEQEAFLRVEGLVCEVCQNITFDLPQKDAVVCTQCDSKLENAEIVIVYQVKKAPPKSYTREPVEVNTDLTSEESQEAHELIENWFGADNERLKVFLQRYFYELIRKLTIDGKNPETVQSDLVLLAHDKQVLGDLFSRIAEQCQEDSRRQQLFMDAAKKFSQKYELSIQLLSDRIKEQQEGIDFVEASIEGGLERLTSPNSLIPFEAFLDGLQKCRSAVCKISLNGREEGTGFLVGPQHVLTCFHNVANGVNDVPKPETIKVKFDSSSNPTDWLDLDTDYTIAHSPYNESEFKGTSAVIPNEDELDYALLKLAKPIKRDHLDVFGHGADPIDKDPLLMVGHPGTVQPDNSVTAPLREMQFSYAAPGFKGPNQNHTRFIYKTSSLRGSSGSPVINHEMKLVALHHAANSKTSNRGVPIAKILEHLQSEFSPQHRDMFGTISDSDSGSNTDKTDESVESESVSAPQSETNLETSVKPQTSEFSDIQNRIKKLRDTLISCTEETLTDYFFVLNQKVNEFEVNKIRGAGRTQTIANLITSFQTEYDDEQGVQILLDVAMEVFRQKKF